MTDHTYDLFISHTDADRAWVEGFLLDALRQAGVDCFLESAFELGKPRLLEFEQAIKQSKRTLLIVTPAYLADGATQIVDVLGQSYGQETGTWPVIPVVREPATLPTRLAMLTSLDMTDPDEQLDAIERLCATLQRPVPGPPPNPPCPYPGMVPFRESDSQRFFGREREIQDLLQQIRLNSFLTVIGPSGSGKSSLVLAGLLPALRKSKLFGDADWQIRTFRPGATPFLSLKTALGNEADAPELQVEQLLKTPNTRLLLVVDQFEEVFTVAQEDALTFQQTLVALSKMSGCVIVLTVRADFYVDLMGSPLWPLIQAHRVEVAPLDEQGMRAAIVRPAEDVGVHVEAALVERLLRDAAGEPGVLPLIQETLVVMWERLQRRFLPLSAYEMLVMSRAAYGQATQTGLQVAMARRADATLAALGAEKQPIARRIFLRLVQFGDGRADTRRQQPFAALRAAEDDPVMFAQTVRHLTDNRLLTLSGDDKGGERKVDISHEALIGGWPTLRGWIDERRAIEQVRRRLEDKAAEWNRLGSGEGGLLDEIELQEAERWLQGPDAADLGYDELLPHLVAASRAALEAERLEREAGHQREIEAARQLAEEAATRERVQREAAHRLRRRAYVLAGVGTVALALAFLSLVALRAALAARNKAESLALASQSNTYLNLDSEQSLALALAAVKRADTTLAENTLREALATHHPSYVLAGHQAAVRAIAWSPIGRYVASGGRDKAIYIWDAQTKKSVAVLLGHTEQIRGLSWSPDGRWLASASYDKTVRLWDMQHIDSSQVAQSQILNGHQGAVYHVVWSPDGNHLASSSQDGTVRIWDPNTRANVATISPDSGEINDVAWSPDGVRIAFATDNWTAEIWRVNDVLEGQETGKSIRGTVLYGHQGPVLSVAWSPDSNRLATGADDGTVRLWRATGGSSIDTLVGHRLLVYSVAWSPDGKQLVSSSFDTTLRVWDTETGETLYTLSGHTNWVTDSRWNSDGTMIASASADTTVRLWDMQNAPSVRIISAHLQTARDVMWNPAGNTLASVGYDGVLRLWVDGATQPEQLFQRSQGHIQDVAWSPQGDRLAFVETPLNQDNGVIRLCLPDYAKEASTSLNCLISDTLHMNLAYQIAWRPDGEQLASISSDGRVRIWHSHTLEPVTTFATSMDGTRSIDWHPDGIHLAISGDDGTIQIWNLQNRQLETTLRGHTGTVWNVSWSPDGQMLASSAQDTTVRLWSWKNPTATPTVLREHKGAVNSVTWSPDGTKLATTSDDATVRIWALSDGRALATLTGSSKGMWRASWTPDGRRVAVAGMDGTVRIFLTNFQEIEQLAQQQDVQQLSTEDISHYLNR